MSNLQEINRALGRVGARVVSDEELRQVAGGFRFNTGACVYDPVACRVISGDCTFVPPECLGQ